MDKIFKLTIDEGNFNSEIVKATRNIEDLKQERQKYDEARKKGIVLTDEEILMDKKLLAQQKANEAQLRNLQKITQLKTEADIAQTGSIDQLTKQYKAAELELKRLGGTVERGVDGELKLTGVFKENEAAANELYQTMKAYDSQIGKHQLNVGNYGGVLVKLKQQITDLDQKRTIANDPEEVMRLTAEIRKLTLQQDQYLGKVDELGNRVAKNDIKDNFSDLQSGAMALTGGLTLLSLAVGDNSKGMQALRVIMLSVTAAQTALTIAQSKADIKASLLIVKTKALAVAQWAYNNAVAAFTLVGAVGLIAALAKIAAESKKQNDETRIALDQIQTWDEMQQAALEREIAKQEELSDFLSNSLNRRKEIAIEESKGIDQSKQKADLLQEEIDNYKIAIDTDTKRKRANVEFGRLEKTMSDDVRNALKSLIFAKQIELNQIVAKNTATDKEIDNSRELISLTKGRESAILLLTEAERKRVDEQIKSQFLDNPNVQDAFQKLLGIDDATFKEVWSQAQEPVSQVQTELKGIEQLMKNIALIQGKTNTDADAWLKTIQQNEEAAYSLGNVMSTVFQAAFTDAEDAQKAFFKSAIIGLLDYLEKFIMEKKVEAAVTQLAGKGFVGVLTGAAIVGLIEGVFSAAKSQISGFADGGLVLPEHGIPIQRENGDNRLATLKTGEVVMNEHHQNKLKQAAGVDIFRKLGIPGFAKGGVMDGGFSFRQATAQTNSSIELRQMVVDAVRSIPASELIISDLERMQGSRNRAVNVTSIRK